MAKEPVRIIQRINTKQAVTHKIQHDIHKLRKGIEIHTKKKTNEAVIEKTKPQVRDGMRLQDEHKVNLDPKILPAAPQPMILQINTTWVCKTVPNDCVVIVNSSPPFVIVAHKEQLDEGSVECWALRINKFLDKYEQK